MRYVNPLVEGSSPSPVIHEGTRQYSNTSISPGKMNGQLVESGHDMDGA
jgi:hypothetical protein